VPFFPVRSPICYATNFFDFFRIWLLKNRDFRLIVSSQLISTLSIFAKDHIGMSGGEIGFLYTLNGLIVIALQMGISRAIGHSNLALRIAFGALFYAVGYFSFAFCRHPWQAFLSVSIFTIGEMLVFPSLSSAASRMAPPAMVGRYMGLYGLVWGLAYSVGPFMGPVLYEHVGDRPVVFWGRWRSSGSCPAPASSG